MAQFNTTELDFDQIKTNLKNHFTRTGSAFADFDFEGSGLSSLLDILAYNTHYNAVNAHMAMNESFLDSAQLRANVVSRAKLLGYTPSSKKAPVATINLTLTRKATSTASEYTLVRGTKFRTVVNDVTYIFQTIEDTTVGLTLSNDSPQVGTYVFNNLKIFQGTQRTIDYTVDNSAFQKFIINYSNVDTSTLKVEVLGTPDDLTPDTYTKFTTFTSIDSTSQIYFLNENGDGFFDVSFGDGVLGKKLSALDIVRLNFLVTDGADSNGATSFTYVSGADEIVTGAATITLVTGGKAAGGAEKESLASVKFNAPLTFISQNRAITAEDFKTLITQNIASAGDVSVWGGEDNDIPNFGEVNISIRPADTSQLTLTQLEKDEVEAFLDSRRVVSIKPVLRDPLYLFLYFETFFKFDITKTTKTKEELVTDVRSTITTFSDNNLNNFDGVFRYSKFLEKIDDTNVAITGSVARLYAYKNLSITVKNSVSANDSLDFGFAIDGAVDQTESMISSSTWTSGSSDVQLADEEIDGDTEKRRVFVFKLKSDGTQEKVENNAGFLFPATGKLTLNNLKADASATVKVKVRPASDDLVAKRQEVISIDMGETTVIGDIDSSVSGVSSLLSSFETVRRDG
tara:strand:- start:3046 stop:4929 length:1884 start_codon:yes stop_codon:yes gene_type:complete